MKRLTLIVIFLLLAGTLVLAGDAWRKANNFSDRNADLDNTVRPLRLQMDELRSEIKDLHKLYMKQLATLEKIDADLITKSPSTPETTATKLLMTPVVKKNTAGSRTLATVAPKDTSRDRVRKPVAQEDNAAEKLLNEFVESMEREPFNAAVSQEKQSPMKQQETKLLSTAYARKEPDEKSDGPRQQIVFKTQTDGTLKNKDALTAVKTPRTTVAAKPAAVTASEKNLGTTSPASNNLPAFLDIDSMVSTTATAVVKAETPKIPVSKPAATVAIPQPARNTVKVAAPGLPGAKPERVTAAAQKTKVPKTQITAVTQDDLNPIPSKQKSAAASLNASVKLPEVVVKKKPETDPDAFVIDLQNEQNIVESESRIVAGIDAKEPIPETRIIDEPDTVSVAPKRVTSVPSVTTEVKAEVVDLRPSQLYKQRKRAADIMRVTMTDQLSSANRQKVKKTMADILDEYDAGSE